MDAERKLSSKTCYLQHPYLQQGHPSGRAPSHTANTAEVCSEEGVKREGSPTPNTCCWGQHRVSCRWSVQEHLSRLCDFGKRSSPDPQFLI